MSLPVSSNPWLLFLNSGTKAAYLADNLPDLVLNQQFRNLYNLVPVWTHCLWLDTALPPLSRLQFRIISNQGCIAITAGPAKPCAFTEVSSFQQVGQNCQLWDSFTV